jgi:uncharacterized damage-inducible protein DinB
MNVHDLLTLYDYNCWANERLLRAAEQLAADEFTRTVGGSYDSVRTTLVHLLEVERGWLARCDGDEGWLEPNPDDFPSLSSIKEEWKRVEQFGREFLARLSEDDLSRKVTYWSDQDGPRSLPLAEMVLHTTNHASHHRGQVAMMLRMLGYAPGNVDMLFYFAVRDGHSLK